LLEAEIQSLIQQYDADMFVNLSSIPGIGEKQQLFLSFYPMAFVILAIIARCRPFVVYHPQIILRAPA